MHNTRNQENSKTHLINWISDFLKLRISCIQQLGTGAIFCQLLDAAFPGRVPLQRVNWRAKTEIEALANFRILVNSLDSLNVKKGINTQKLAKMKFQDNIELLQWFRGFVVEKNNELASYNAEARRGRVDIEFPDFKERKPNQHQPQQRPLRLDLNNTARRGRNNLDRATSYFPKSARAHLNHSQQESKITRGNRSLSKSLSSQKRKKSKKTHNDPNNKNERVWPMGPLNRPETRPASKKQDELDDYEVIRTRRATLIYQINNDKNLDPKIKQARILDVLAAHDEEIIRKNRAKMSKIIREQDNKIEDLKDQIKEMEKKEWKKKNEQDIAKFRSKTLFGQPNINLTNPFQTKMKLPDFPPNNTNFAKEREEMMQKNPNNSLITASRPYFSDISRHTFIPAKLRVNDKTKDGNLTMGTLTPKPPAAGKTIFTPSAIKRHEQLKEEMIKLIAPSKERDFSEGKERAIRQKSREERMERLKKENQSNNLNISQKEESKQRVEERKERGEERKESIVGERVVIIEEDGKPTRTERIPEKINVGGRSKEKHVSSPFSNRKPR